MILFVFEGGKAEPMVFDSIGKLFLSGEEVRVVSCRYDLPTLYKNLKLHDYDLFRILPFKENGISLPEGKRVDTLFSQIFLFFDYDFQNRIGLARLNTILTEMLEYFDDETDNGKLYINYPMVESLKYTKEMPDPHYLEYIATHEECVQHQFKSNAERFAYPGAKAYRFIDITKTDGAEVMRHWDMLKVQNVSKAHWLVTGHNTMPIQKDTINQAAIFDAERFNYVEVSQSVSILNSFPIFLYEYMR